MTLTILAGSMACARRGEAFQALAARGTEAGLLVVLPGTEASAAWRARLVHEGTAYCDRCVTSWEELDAALCADGAAGGGPATVVDNAAWLMLIRDVLLERPGDFPDLVRHSHGAHGGGIVTAGILERLGRVVDRVRRNGLRGRGGEERPREQQILRLTRAVLDRMRRGGAVRDSDARAAMWAQVAEGLFQRVFPHVRTVLWDGFEYPQAAVVEAMRVLVQAGVECAVLLGELPDEGAALPPVLARSRGRLFELAGGRPHAEERGSAGELAPRRVTVAVARSREAELAAAAAAVRDFMAREAAPGRAVLAHDVVVCLPQAARYERLAAEAFAEWGLDGGPAGSMPLVENLVWRALAIARYAVASSFGFDSLREIAKCPLLRFGGAPIAVDLLDRVRRETAPGLSGYDFEGRVRAYAAQLARMSAADRRQMRGAAQLQRGRLPDSEQLLATAATLHAALDALAPLGRVAHDVAQWPEVIGSLLDRILPDEDQAMAAGLTAGEIQSLRITAQAVRALCTRLAELASLLSSKTMGCVEYIDHLEVLAADWHMPNAACDPGGIPVLRPRDALGIRPKLLVVAGLVDGEYPQLPQPRQGWLDRLAQQARRPDDEIAMQRSVFEQLVAEAQSEVLLLYPSHDGSEELLRSQFLEPLLADGVACSAAEAQAPCAAAVDSATPKEPERPGTPDACGTRDGVVRGEDLAAWLAQWVDNHVFSPSELDVLVQCPFRYYVEYVLGLHEDDEEEDFEITPLIVGLALHRALFRFYRRWKDERRGLVTADVRDVAEQYLSEAAHSVANELPVTSFGRHWLLCRLLGWKALPPHHDDVADAEWMEYPAGLLPAFLELEVQRSSANPGLLVPEYFEAAFGGGRSAADPDRGIMLQPEPVELDMGGRRVRLGGRVDRIDIRDDVFTVVDYKTGKPPTIKSQLAGQRVQVPLYLMAVEELLRNAGRNPVAAGGFFYHIRPGRVAVDGRFLRDIFRGMEVVGERQKCLSEDEYARAMEQIRERIGGLIGQVARGDFRVPVARSKGACGHCPHGPLCRK